MSYIKNIPLSSQTVICTSVLLLHLTTTTYILTKKPDIYIYMEPYVFICLSKCQRLFILLRKELFYYNFSKA
nr:MAG TPA: hypothetical protein [Caudoviricetes sp.]